MLILNPYNLQQAYIVPHDWRSSNSAISSSGGEDFPSCPGTTSAAKALPLYFYKYLMRLIDLHTTTLI
jgi:hypothetical protein